MHSQSVFDLENWLIENAVPSGGWAYYSNKSASIEPTCLALLALKNSKYESSKEFASAIAFLESCIGPNGIAVSPNGRPEAVWVTSIVLFTFVKLKLNPTAISSMVSILLEIKGTVTKNNQALEIHANGINPQVMGWPWSLNTFSWVEPTAWALLSLRSVGLQDNPRVMEGIEFLLDRLMDEGGANYGNKTVLGKLLDPVPGPTALCLLALNGTKGATNAKVGASIAYLKQSIFVPLDLEHAFWSVLACSLYLNDNRDEIVQLESAITELLASFCKEFASESQPLAKSVCRVSLALLANKSIKENPFAINLESKKVAFKKAYIPSESWGEWFKKVIRRLLIDGLGGVQVRQNESLVAWKNVISYDEDVLLALREMYQSFKQKVPLAGKKIFIKPNIVEFNSQRPIHTNPMVVDAMIRLCIEEGAAEIVVGEGSGHRRNMGCLLRECGLEKVLAEHKIRFVDINYDQTKKVVNLGSKSGLGFIYFSKEAYEADVLISVPKLKTHHWTNVTLSLKNLFGIASGQAYGWPKNELHFQGIVNSIVDINSTRKADLSLVDGIVGMQGDGPLYGDSIKSNILLMSDDPVAIDATCARLMGFDPAKIDHIGLSAKVGLGNLESDKIKLVGMKVGEFPQLKFDSPPGF